MIPATYFSNFINILMSLVFKPNESTTCQWALKISNELLSKMSLVAYWLKKKKKNACQCRRHRFHPWSGKIPHVLEQLSLFDLHSSAHSPHQEKPLWWEPSALKLESNPHLLQLGKAYAAMKTQRSQKIIIIIINFFERTTAWC